MFITVYMGLTGGGAPAKPPVPMAVCVEATSAVAQVSAEELNGKCGA